MQPQGHGGGISGRSDPNRTASGSTAPRQDGDRIFSRETFIARLTSPTAMDEATQRSRPRVLGVHHLKFAVSNLDVSIAWYERVMGARRIPSLDHVRADGSRFAAVCEMTDWNRTYLELRQHEVQAQKDRGWDPVTLSVRGRQDLLDWITWLDRWGTTHSPLLVGVRGWLLVFEVSDYSVEVCTALTLTWLTRTRTAGGSEYTLANSTVVRTLRRRMSIG